MHTDASAFASRSHRALRKCALCTFALVAGALAAETGAQTLSAKAKESGCVDAPKVVEGATYRCTTSSGAAAYFNLPGGTDAGLPDRSPRRAAPAPAMPAPAGFPRVDADTQRSRDDMRRKVLGDELTSEEKLLAEARVAYANGAPAALPDEQANPQKYSDRIAKLRQAVQLHERNIEALRKELSSTR